jgi:acetyltransferase-like isoleucine patch superfamily enzyme
MLDGTEHDGTEHDPELRIGDECTIGSDLCVHCTHDVEIGSRVGFSARVAIGDGINAVNPWLAANTEDGGDASIRIRDGALLGIGSIVLPGVTIGERAAVGAGAVVTRDVPPRTVVFGNPARVVGSWNEETGEWLSGLAAPR